MSQEPPRRAETGPMAFGTDGPGVFIRGDRAMAYAMRLRQLLDQPSNLLARAEVEILIWLLGGCNMPPGFLDLLKRQSTPEFPVTNWAWCIDNATVGQPTLTVYGKVPKLPLGDSGGIDRITKAICAYLPAGINVRVVLTEPGPPAPGDPS